MKWLSLDIDEKMEETLETLRKDLGKSDKAEVLRAAVAAYVLLSDIVREGDSVAVMGRGMKPKGVLELSGVGLSQAKVN